MKPIKTMSIVRLATNRRVTISMLALAAVVFGFVSVSRLKLNLLPELSYPTLTIRTELPGAAPQEVENLITKPIEEAVGVIKNVRVVRSTSRPGQSDVTLEFTWGTNMDYAGVDVREKLDVLNLPREAKRPILLRFDPSTEPVMRYGFAPVEKLKSNMPIAGMAENDRLRFMREYADNQLTKGLDSVSGVAAIKASGGLEDEIQVLVDQNKLARLNLSIETIANRLKQENINLAGGKLEQGNQKFLVRTINEFKTISQIANSIIALHDNQPVYLHDVAVVKRGHKERKAITRINGKEAVELAIYKEGDANTVSVSRAVEKAVTSLSKRLPQGTRLIKVYDQSTFISSSIDDVVNSAILGGLLAAFVLYLFLRNIWVTAIVAITIPLSVIATFIPMYAGNITLNIMSLGGIALAIGMLVDNSIVVLENISRHRNMGEDILTATQLGTSEVGTAIIASTLTTVAVFFPMVFVTGIAGQLFRDQSLTVTYSVLFSLLVALTVIPMLSTLHVPAAGNLNLDGKGGDPGRAVARNIFTRGLYRLLHYLTTAINFLVFGLLRIFVLLGMGFGWLTGKLIHPVVEGFQRGYARLENFYPKVITWSLHHKSTVLVFAVLSLVVSVLMVPSLGVELIPQMTQGEFKITLTLPPGTPLAQTDGMIRLTQEAAAKLPQVATTYSVAGTGNRLDANPTDAGENIGTVNVVLQHGLGHEAETVVMNKLRTTLSSLPGVEYKFERPSLFTLKTPLEIEVVGYDLAGLRDVSTKIAKALGKSSRFTDIKNSMEGGQPEVQIYFDEAKAAQLGLITSEIATTVVNKVRGQVATQYNLHDRKIDILVRNEARQRDTLANIRNLIINPGSPHPVTLSAVADVKISLGPSEIRRIGQERVAVVSANLGFGDLGTAATDANRIISKISTPPGIYARIAGQNQEMQSSFRSMQFALGLAVFLVYLVMAAQFESLIHPFVILLSVPLALVGAILALAVTHTTISVVVFIGLIMLAGIVVNNAIVLVDLVNQLRRRGMARDDALVEAGRSRLRPIVMTMLTTTLGLLPMALGIGNGAEIRAPMAITVIGGMLVSTLLTLVVIPVAYAIMNRRDPVSIPDEDQIGTAVGHSVP